MTVEPIINASQLYREGKKVEAAQLLSNYVKENPNSTEGWYGLALCLSDPDKKKLCLNKVLRIDPYHQGAKKALEKLTTPAVVSTPAVQSPVSSPSVVQSPGPSTKKCPYCAETIQAEAIVCRFCHRDLVEQPQVSSAAEQKSGERFQPRYLTAAGGIGILVGTFLPWQIQSQGNTIVNQTIGIVSLSGIIAFLAGCIVVAISLTSKTKPSYRTAPIAALIALAVFVISWILMTGDSYNPCYDEIFSNGRSDSCLYIDPGSGYHLSMISCAIAFITGLVKNPK